MALKKSLSNDGFATEDTYTPITLSNPRIFLYSMIIFLIIVAFVAAVLYRQISTAFQSNPGLNGLIFGVLLIGIILAFGQVIRLFREVRWVNSYLAGLSAPSPVLLAPMQALFSRSSQTALSTSSMRSILDSIATRLDESRDISRYLIGLLVFLGLLGTFWGLLQTISSIGNTIQSLEPGSGSANDLLNSLKEGLAAPLNGMGTAFSSSLFGLSGSLILGFLDLQAGRSQTRFYTELENWLSSVTDIDSGLAGSHHASGISDEVDALRDRMRSMQDGSAGSQRTTAAIASLAEGVAGLVKTMRQDQQMLQQMLEGQSADQRELREALAKLTRSLESMDKR